MNLYYTPMSNDVFQEVKQNCFSLWKVIDTDNYGYAEEKQVRIVNLENIQDNGMTMVAMFDICNQKKLSNMLSEKANSEISQRLAAGGTPTEINVFLN